jgi:hypothetical protein
MKFLPLAVVAGVLVASFAFGKPAQNVEHAPTVQQCQADQAYWFSKLEQTHGTDDVTYGTLQGWHTEMDQCAVVDPSNRWKYYNTMSESDAEVATRLMRFVERHNLWKQFIAEDAAGVR